VTGKEARERARECGNARSRTLGKRSDDDRRVHGSEQAFRLPPLPKPRDPARRAIEATQRKQAIEDAPGEPPTAMTQRVAHDGDNDSRVAVTCRPDASDGASLVAGPVSGSPVFDRLPSRSGYARSGLTRRSAPAYRCGGSRAYGRFSRSPHSRFISGGRIPANTCCSKFYRAPSRKSRSNALRPRRARRSSADCRRPAVRAANSRDHPAIIRAPLVFWQVCRFVPRKLYIRDLWHARGNNE
jgi:hypothetical protein